MLLGANALGVVPMGTLASADPYAEAGPLDVEDAEAAPPADRTEGDASTAGSEEPQKKEHA